MRLKTMFVCMSLFMSQGVMCQLNNQPEVPNIPTFELEVFDDSFSGYYLFGMSIGDVAKKKYILLIDHQGAVVWWKSQQAPFNDNDFKFNTEQNQYAYTSGNRRDSVYHIRLDTNFEVIDTINIAGPYDGDSHEFLVLPNGNKIITGVNRTLMDLSAFTIAGQSGSDSTTVRSNIIQEFDSNGNLIYSWDGLDYIHPTEYVHSYNYQVNDFDYTHINAVDMDVDGNLVVSMRHTNTIYKIDWKNKTGNIIWRLGGKSSDFTFIGDTLPFSGQHDIRILPNGQYSLFDNGNSKSEKLSRALHYELDTTNMTTNATWIYTHPTNVYSRAMGNNQYVSDEYSLINWGWVERPIPTFTLANRQGQTLVNCYAEDQYLSYRAFAYESLPEFSRPIITCDVVNQEYVLNAPLGYDSYLWSTGETTASIVVADTNTYMVWVSQGVGHLASMPFSVADPENPCLLSSVEVANMTTDKKIRLVFDVAGRQIAQPKENQLYLVAYESGESELIMWKASLLLY